MASGVRWALNTRVSNGMSNSDRTSAASRMVGRSDSLPMAIATRGEDMGFVMMMLCERVRPRYVKVVFNGTVVYRRSGSSTIRFIDNYFVLCALDATSRRGEWLHRLI